MTTLQQMIKKDQSLNLSKEQKKALNSRLNRGSLSYLSPDRETGPFMLFLAGESLETIAKQTKLPIEVIMLTAMNYNWTAKREAMNGDGEGHMTIMKQMGNLLLNATFMSIQEQLGDIAAGRKKPDECPLIPKNVHSLEKLMSMVQTLYAPPKPGSTVVHAENVQINQGVEPVKPKELTDEKKAENLAKYEKLRQIKPS